MNSSSARSDVELGTLRDGYPALATWIARDPDSETFIFRKFNRLSARNILHLQAQLTAVEHEINCFDEEARQSNDFEARQSSRRWETLMSHSNDAHRPERERVELLNKMKSLLREYYEFLTLQSHVAAMKKPRDRPLSAFRAFLDGKAAEDTVGKTINLMPLISGRAKTFLEDKDDLVALANPIEDDHLSRFLHNYWLFRKRKTADPLDRTTIYKNSHIVRTVANLDLALAAVLLIGAIVNLYFVTGQKAKLGLIAMYTMLFASSVALCTNAKRAEVFAATAAYAAVLVVFVSGELGGSNSQQCLIQLEGAIWKTVKCPD